MTHAKSGIDITIITDNKGYAPLKKQEFNDFMTEYPSIKISFLKTVKKCHDRYIATDYGKKTMKIYHCGASSKDAGNKITTMAIYQLVVDIYKFPKHLCSGLLMALT